MKKWLKSRLFSKKIGKKVYAQIFAIAFWKLTFFPLKIVKFAWKISYIRSFFFVPPSKGVHYPLYGINIKDSIYLSFDFMYIFLVTEKYVKLKLYVISISDGPYRQSPSTVQLVLRTWWYFAYFGLYHHHKNKNITSLNKWKFIHCWWRWKIQLLFFCELLLHPKSVKKPWFSENVTTVLKNLKWLLVTSDEIECNPSFSLHSYIFT